MRLFLLLTLTAILPDVAFAHAEAHAGNGFATGFLHPITGVDHVLAMLSVGLWGAILGAPAVWVLPIAFPLVMALGAAAGILGLPLPGVEIGIAASVILLGGAIAANLRPPLAAAGLLVAGFAVFHGYAHGAELPEQAGAVAYGLGFVLATGLIHLVGIGLGFVTSLPRGLQVLRVGGGAIACAGLLIAYRLATG